MDLSAASDSEAEQFSETGSLDGDIHRDRSADKEPSRDDPETEPTEEANYRETMRGVRSFMNWHRVPEFETVSSAADDNPFAGTCVQPTGKVSVKLPVDDWLCRKMSSLNLTIKEGYPTRILTTLASSGISSSKPLDLLAGTGCMLKKTVRVLRFVSGHRIRPNSTTLSAGLPEEICHLLHPLEPSVRISSDAGRGQLVNRQ